MPRPAAIGTWWWFRCHRGAEYRAVAQRLPVAALLERLGLGDAVSTIAEHSNDGTEGVDDAMTEVITELDHIIFETHGFLSGIVSAPMTTPHRR